MKDFAPDDQLIASYLSCECTEKEHAKIEEWLKKAPENRDYLRRYQEIWSTQKRQGHVWNTEHVWSIIETKAGIHHRSKVIPKWFSGYFFKEQYQALKIAASVLLLVSISYLSYIIVTNQQSIEQSFSELIVPKGTQNKLTMMDGTVVVLDAGSSFSYPDEFTGRKREVTLEGEGYFEVVSDKSRPFIVNTGDAVIQVLGTKFAVRNWPLDKSIQVAVREGKVGLRTTVDRLQDAVVITGGQVAAMLESGRIQPPESVEIDIFLGWLNRDIQFDDATLEEIIFHLERWFDVEFEIAKSVITSERMTLSTNKKSIDTILEMMAVLADLTYRRTGKTITLSRG